MDFNVFFTSLVNILNEMSPYILLGFLIAGFLNEFVKPETMSRHLAGKGWKPIVKAAMFGVPLPLCSCGVLPTAVGLHRQGASRGATTSFLIATPQTGVDSIAATYSLLGLPLAIIRPIAALVGGFVGGISVNAFDRSEEVSYQSCQAGCGDNGNTSGTIRRPFGQRIMAAIKYGLVDMVGNVGKWLVIGLLVAALITVYVPDKFLLSLSDRPLLAMLAMIVVAVPMYVCATGSIPIAMSLMLKGLNPGAAFVLLMAGPAANFASMMVLGRAIGRRATIIYVASVVVTALAFGLMVDYLFPAEWFSFAGNGMVAGECHHHFGWFETGCTLVLLSALVYSFIINRKHHHSHELTTNNDNSMTKEFKITGMSCNHCRMTVEKAIAAIPGVEHVSVDLADASAKVDGEFDTAAVISAVSNAGFDIEQ